MKTIPLHHNPQNRDCEYDTPHETEEDGEIVWLEHFNPCTCPTHTPQKHINKPSKPIETLIKNGKAIEKHFGKIQ